MDRLSRPGVPDDHQAQFRLGAATSANPDHDPGAAVRSGDRLTLAPRRQGRFAALAVAVGLFAAVTLPGLDAGAAVAPAVLSLDQCADQYVLALSPPRSVVGVSMRARNADSFLAAQATGLPLRRADTESVLAARPALVVRSWGGDIGLLRTLRRRGVAVLSLEDATDFEGVRRNIRAVAARLGQGATGEVLVRRMDATLAASRGAWGGRGAIYLTSGGATAGSGTFLDTILRGAGLRNLAHGEGYSALSLERLTLSPPDAVVEGFFDRSDQATVHWGPGRHGAMMRITAGHTLVSLPGRLLACPAWFSADAVALIAAAAPARAQRRCQFAGGGGPNARCG